MFPGISFPTFTTGGNSLRIRQRADGDHPLGCILREDSEILHRLSDIVEVDLLANLVLTRIVLGLLLVEYQTRKAPARRLADIAGELPGYLANLLRWGKLDPRATTEELHHQLDTTER